MNHSKENNHFLLLGLCISMFTWGLSWPAGKVLSHYGPAMEIAFLRFIFTFISLLVLLRIYKQPLAIQSQGFPTLIVAGICMSVYSYLFFQGLSKGMPGAGGVLVTTLNPIIAYSIGLIIHRKKPTTFELIGLFLGLTAGGILLKVWVNEKSILDIDNSYFIAASFTWAILSLFTSKGARYGTSSSFSLWMYLACSIGMFIFVDKPVILSMLLNGDGIFWFNLFFSAVITTALATTFYFYATAKIGAEKASGFIFLVPTSAALASMLFLGEQIQWHTIVGGGLGALAVITMNLKQAER